MPSVMSVLVLSVAGIVVFTLVQLFLARLNDRTFKNFSAVVCAAVVALLGCIIVEQVKVDRQITSLHAAQEQSVTIGKQFENCANPKLDHAISRLSELEKQIGHLKTAVSVEFKEREGESSRLDTIVPIVAELSDQESRAIFNDFLGALRGGRLSNAITTLEKAIKHRESEDRIWYQLYMCGAGEFDLVVKIDGEVARSGPTPIDERLDIYPEYLKGLLKRPPGSHMITLSVTPAAGWKQEAWWRVHLYEVDSSGGRRLAITRSSSAISGDVEPIKISFDRNPSRSETE